MDKEIKAHFKALLEINRKLYQYYSMMPGLFGENRGYLIGNEIDTQLRTIEQKMLEADKKYDDEAHEED